MAQKYIDIQNEVIKKYRIDICDGTKCKDGDWDRTHAHVKQRRVCKWKQANSIASTFTLFHEIGHIETTKSTMRRCEEEYYATVWAIERCDEYKLEVPTKTIQSYQRYIDMEHARGLRRKGNLPALETLQLPIKVDMKAKKPKKATPKKEFIIPAMLNKEDINSIKEYGRSFSFSFEYRRNDGEEDYEDYRTSSQVINRLIEFVSADNFKIEDYECIAVLVYTKDFFGDLERVDEFYFE